MKNKIFINWIIKHTVTSLKNEGGFGMNELLGIAAALILAAFIIIPQLQEFAANVMGALDLWWTGQVTAEIFPPASSFN